MPVGVATQEFEALLTGAEFAMGAAAAPQILITIAARFGRISWKYSSIAYALILKDVGVLMQTLYLMATDMGLGGCAIGITNIDLFAKMTGIEFHVEGPVGQFAFGRGMESAASDLTIDSRPRTRQPAPIPRGFRVRRIARLCVRNSRSALRSAFPSARTCALRVDAFGDPVAARHFHRTVEDLAAAGLHAFRRRVDVVDIEIVKPERRSAASEAW